MELKTHAYEAIKNAKNLQDALNANKTLSKRQRLTRRGVCVAFGQFQNERENALRKNKQRPYCWATYGAK